MLNLRRSERGISVPGGMLAVAAVGTIFAGSYLYSQGLIRISVHENHPGGDHVRLAIPGAIVPMVMAFVPASEIGRHMHLPAEARQQLPAVEAALSELQKLPDCTLVEVEGPEEHVRVQVRSGEFVVDVDDHGDEVHVTLPMGSVHSVLSKVKSAVEYASQSGSESDRSSHSWGCHHRFGHDDGDKDAVSDDADAGSDSSDEPAQGSSETF